MIYTVITFFCSLSLIYGQMKPQQLRKEILQSQQKPVTPPAKAAKKPKNNQPLPVGATVLKPANPLAIPNAKLVNIENSDVFSVDQMTRPDVQLLKGNVRFRHDNALLYCDSAYFNEKLNYFDAFSNVRIVQGDTLTAYGDFLNYDGNTKIARLRDNVRMINRNTTLTTDSMIYDRNLNLMYYYTGGKIVDGTNKLTSDWGEYSPATHKAVFRFNVKLVNPDFTMNSDTLIYNTTTKVADIVGKTHIVYKNETDIYSKRGWYNTATERMMLLDRSLVKHREGKSITGDTIFYDKKIKYGESYSNVMMIDTVQKSTLYGHYVSYDEIKKKGLATDSALLVDWSSKDTLYLSADTLKNKKDSIFNKVDAYKNVRVFRKDIQAMCDSLLYDSRDSILHLNGDPVLWAENNQLLGNKITAYTKNQKINRVHIEQSAISIQRDTLNYFNQLAGKEIIAHLDSGQVRRVNVNGNAETIYFVKDDKTREFIGVNKTISSFIAAHLYNKKIERVVLTKASSGTMYPLTEMGENDLYLRNFYWYEKERPMKYDDVFERFPRVERPKRPDSAKRPSFPDEAGAPSIPKSKNTGNQNTRDNNNMQNNNRFDGNNSVTGRPFNMQNIRQVVR